MGLFQDLYFDIAAKAAPAAPDDYINEDGFRMCGKCHTPKERMMVDIPNIDQELIAKVFGRDRKTPCPCKCRLEEMEAQEREEKRREAAMKAERRRRQCFHTAADAACTFAVDDRAIPQVSDAMRKYAEGFKGMMEGADRYGLLLYGPVGTGKTFYAACVANALLEQGYSVELTSFSRIVNTMQGMFDDKQAYIDRLARKDLLIIDDLGVERDSEYMQEQVTNIIDARYKSGKPLIVTTNISIEEIKKPKDLTYRRMYDRLLEMCFPVKVEGKSRRRASVAENYAARQAALGLVVE